MPTTDAAARSMPPRVELDGEMAAKVLGISQSACSTRLSRALQKLEGMVSADAVA